MIVGDGNSDNLKLLLSRSAQIYGHIKKEMPRYP